MSATGSESTGSRKMVSAGNTHAPIGVDINDDSGNGGDAHFSTASELIMKIRKSVYVYLCLCLSLCRCMCVCVEPDNQSDRKFRSFRFELKKIKMFSF